MVMVFDSGRARYLAATAAAAAVGVEVHEALAQAASLAVRAKRAFHRGKIIGEADQTRDLRAIEQQRRGRGLFHGGLAHGCTDATSGTRPAAAAAVSAPDARC